ncbi:hypothetical protein BACFRA24663_07750 [Bacteroides fragilis]
MRRLSAWNIDVLSKYENTVKSSISDYILYDYRRSNLAVLYLYFSCLEFYVSHSSNLIDRDNDKRKIYRKGGVGFENRPPFFNL